MAGLIIRDKETETKHQSFSYTDPKKFKREMMFLKQDIEKAQTDKDTTLVERLKAAQNKATNTAQALNAGMTLDEASQYANREVNIALTTSANRNTPQGGAGLRIRNKEDEKKYDSLSYSDPNKLKREMMFLQQDIRAAQADRDTTRLNQLKSKLDRANYTVQGLNAGMTPDEAQQYGSRQAGFSAKTAANRNAPQGGAGLSRYEVDPTKHQSFSYTDPKKFKREMLSLNEDIREAQANGDSARANQLKAKENKANYTVQGLNAGMTEAEAQQYADRQANIAARASANRDIPQGGAGFGAASESQNSIPRNKTNDTKIMAPKNSNLSNNGTPKSGLPSWLANYEGPAGASSQAGPAVELAPAMGAGLSRGIINGKVDADGKPLSRGIINGKVGGWMDGAGNPPEKDLVGARTIAGARTQSPFPKVDNSPIPDNPDRILKMLQGLPKQPAVDKGTGWSAAKQLSADIGSRQKQLIDKANSLGMDVSYLGAKGFKMKPMTAEQLAARDTAKQTQATKPGDIKLGPGGLPPEFRNQATKPGDIKLGPNSRPIQSSLTGTPPPAWDGRSRGPQSLKYLEWLQANPDGGKPGGPGTISGTPRPGDPLYTQDWKGNPPILPQPYLPVQRPFMEGADFARVVTTVTPEFNYTDPKKFKKEMLNLKQDIREAQADGNTDKLKQLIDKQNRANYTVQGLNSGLSQSEAERYAKREADIEAKVNGKGAPAGRIEEPGTVKRPSKTEMEELQRRANGGDQRAQIEVAKQQPANNFTGKSPYARTTPEESWALEKAAAAGDKRAKNEIALRRQTKDETGNHTLNMSRPALDSLHGLKGTPAQIEAAEFAKRGQGAVPTIPTAEAQRLANGTPAEQAKYDKLKKAGQLPGQDGKPIAGLPVNRGIRTADFQDRNGNGKDDRDKGNRRGEVGGRGGSLKPTEKEPEKQPEPAKQPPSRGGGGSGGRGRGGGKPRETAKERNAKMEAEADKQRDRLERKIAAGFDPATNKWSTPKYQSRLPEKGKSSFPDKNNPTPSEPNFSGNVHRSKAAGGKGWQGYADDWTAEANRLRKSGDLKGAEEAEKAAKQYSSYKEGDNPYASIPKLSDKNKPTPPSNSGEVNANGDINIGLPDTSSNPDVTYTPGSPNTTGRPLSSNNSGFNNGGGMSGGQGGGGGGGNSGSGGRFVTINGQVRYFA